MKVDFMQGKVRLIKYGKGLTSREVEVSKSSLSKKISSLLPNPTAIILLCRLPWITTVVYRVQEHSLAYKIPCGEIEFVAGDYELDTATETIFDIDEDISNIFEQYFC